VLYQKRGDEDGEVVAIAKQDPEEGQAQRERFLAGMGASQTQERERGV
jgi:hypothetical protein